MLGLWKSENMPFPDNNIEVSNARDNAIKNLRCTTDRWDPYIDRSIFNRIIERFGVENQISMVMEECSELILAISHYRRGRVMSSDIIEEIVDVTIMMEQARLIYDPENTEFGRIYTEKINRMENMLKDK